MSNIANGQLITPSDAELELAVMQVLDSTPEMGGGKVRRVLNEKYKWNCSIGPVKKAVQKLKQQRKFEKKPEESPLKPDDNSHISNQSDDISDKIEDKEISLMNSSNNVDSSNNVEIKVVNSVEIEKVVDNQSSDTEDLVCNNQSTELDNLSTLNASNGTSTKLDIKADSILSNDGSNESSETSETNEDPSSFNSDLISAVSQVNPSNSKQNSSNSTSEVSAIVVNDNKDSSSMEVENAIVNDINQIKEAQNNTNIVENISSTDRKIMDRESEHNQDISTNSSSNLKEINIEKPVNELSHDDQDISKPITDFPIKDQAIPTTSSANPEQTIIEKPITELPKEQSNEDELVNSSEAVADSAYYSAKPQSNRNAQNSTIISVEDQKNATCGGCLLM